MFESGFIGNYTKSLMNIRTMKKDLQKQVLFSIYY